MERGVSYHVVLCFFVVLSLHGSAFSLVFVFLLEQNEPLYVKVNKLSSTKTQLPYDYYYLKYCKPTKIDNSAENLGEVLRGDRIENSVYTVSIYFVLMSNSLMPSMGLFSFF